MPVLEKGLVIRHIQVSRGMYELEFIAPEIAQESKPGQFVHIRSTLENNPLLRRPLSLYDVDKKLGSITLLYKVVGSGTNLLSRIRTKEHVDVMGPLGKGFTLVASRKNPVLVGGGVGIAPLVYLARVLQYQGCNVKVIHGVENRSELVALPRLREIGVEFLAATGDGSAGFKGLVTDLLQKEVNPADIDFIYCCGPEPMMAKVSDFARQHNIAAEISLEEYMACGVGACLGCARKMKKSDNEYKKICKDGPVFSIEEVEL